MAMADAEGISEASLNSDLKCGGKRQILHDKKKNEKPFAGTILIIRSNTHININAGIHKCLRLLLFSTSRLGAETGMTCACCIACL